MKHLNKTAAEILSKLIEGMKPGDNKKIDNTNGTFMPVCVEFLRRGKEYNYISIAHYYEQNGDLMSDPDMVFIFSTDPQVKEIQGYETFYPISFQQDNMGIYQEVVASWGADGQVKSFRPKLSAGLCSFANMWLRNIRDQQGL